MAKDQLYFEFLAQELRDQRNQALDDAARLAVELRLANLHVAALETENFQAEEDYELLASLYTEAVEWNITLIEDNENARTLEALAASYDQLKRDYDALVTEFNERGAELDEERAEDDNPASTEQPITNLPVLIPTVIVNNQVNAQPVENKTDGTATTASE